MAADALADARAALASQRPDLAIQLLWEAVRPAVLDHDNEALAAARDLAEEIALTSQGHLHEEAAQFAAYCTECALDPRPAVPSTWSLDNIFNRTRQQRTRCPECAEKIAVDAHVCRYCGHRLH